MNSKFFKLSNLPNVLTCVRLLGGALIVPVLIFYLLPLGNQLINVFVAVVFGLFSMTDFLDGYLARRYGLETVVGRILDPIADKFLVCSALIALLAVGKIYFMWVILLIGREICMLSLRNFAALYNLVVPVSYLGKIKACLQMFLITLIIIRPIDSSVYGLWGICEKAILFLTLYFSIKSLYRYTINFRQNYLKLV